MRLREIASLVALATMANVGLRQDTIVEAKHNVVHNKIKKAKNLMRGGGAISDIPPGVGLRIGQHTMDAFIANMDGFFPQYFVADLALPATHHQEFSFLWETMVWNLWWKDIYYDTPEFDIKDIKFEMNRDERMIERNLPGRLTVKFPALKKFHMHAIQDCDSWWIPDDEKVSLDFDDFEVDFICSMHLNDQGNLRPIFYKFHMNFGDSYLEYDNVFWAFVMHQIVEFAIIMIENTAFFCGELIMSELGEPVLTSFFNDYKFPLSQMPTPFLGQEGTVADFTLDWRPTRDPDIRQGAMDARMLGEILYRDYACSLAPDPFEFMADAVYSQAVMTESAASCMFNAVAASPIGKLTLDQTRTNQLFNVTGIKTDTTSIAAHIPLFQQKLGPNKPLRAMVGANHITVTFGQFDCDMIVDYTLEFAIFEDKADPKELIYDEIKVITSMDISTLNDDVTVKVLENKLNIDIGGRGRTLPVRNNMKMTPKEYREFISALGFSAKYFRDWINESVFAGTVRLPYRPNELLTRVKFQDKSAHVFFEIENEFLQMMQAEFWK